jgi:hypothetical protein
MCIGLRFAFVGIAASILLRSGPLRSAASLGAALVVAGTCALFALSRRDSFDEETWATGQLVVAAFIAITMVAFGIARTVKHLVVRKSAT